MWYGGKNPTTPQKRKLLRKFLTGSESFIYLKLYGRKGPRFFRILMIFHMETQYLRKWIHLFVFAIRGESLSATDTGVPKSMGSKPRHSWHFGPNNSLLWGAFDQQVEAGTIPPHPQLRQPKMSPDTARCPLGGRTVPSWEPLASPLAITVLSSQQFLKIVLQRSLE